ncbi:MAG: histidine--tRNA ligase [Rhizobiales bacterium]|nr:histidine--tRNA ligase [Hyphomicrobiales bacterium]
MSNKADKLKARLPRGLSDRTAGELRATERMLATIRRVYERYGFEPVETPLIEYTDALGKFLPDQDRPNEGVFSFQDDDEQWLSLRYDLTAPLARYVAENYDRLPKPYRSYRAGWVFRNEKPGPGRFRQFMQFDADTVGASSPAADAEICMMAADTLIELGVPAGQFMVKVNSRRVLDGVMEAASIADAHQRLTVLRAIDKFDRLGIAGVRDLLGAGRKDESGDFTRGAGLTPSQAEIVLSVLADDGGASLGAALARSSTGAAGRDELATIGDLVRAAGYEDRVQIDPTVVRGLEYYTGAVFEAQLTFEVPNERGQPVVFGSVGGGGRYDGLVGRFMKENVPATGFSVGVSRLAAALSAIGKLDMRDAAGPVVVLVMDKARLADYQRMVATLRAAGIPAEMYLGESGMRAQMKYADRRQSPVAVIQGEDEKARGVVQLKDLVEGARIAAGISGHDEYREARPGQVEVAEGQLVAEVRAMLGPKP